MQVKTSYSDLIGKAEADISNPNSKRNSIKEIAKNFNIDTERFEVVGIDINGTKDFYVSFLAIDNQGESNQLVRIRIPNQTNFKKLFEQFKIVLFDKYRTDLFELEVEETIKI